MDGYDDVFYDGCRRDLDARSGEWFSVEGDIDDFIFYGEDCYESGR